MNTDPQPCPGQLRLRHWLSYALTTRLHLIHSSATSHPHLATSHPHLATSSHPHLATSYPLLATSHPLSATSHPHLATSHPHLATSHPLSTTSYPHPSLNCSLSHEEPTWSRDSWGRACWWRRCWCPRSGTRWWGRSSAWRSPPLILSLKKKHLRN